MTLTTPRLILTDEPDHLAAVRQLITPAITATSWSARRILDPASLPESGNPTTKLAITLASRDVIGFISLELQDRIGWLSYFLSESYWNYGFSTEAVDAVMRWALDTLALDAVAAMTLRSNAPSERILRKLGMSLLREAPVTINNHPDAWRYYALARPGLRPEDVVQFP